MFADRIKEEAIKIELHPNTVHREERFPLSRMWKLLILSLRRKVLSKTRQAGYFLEKRDSSIRIQEEERENKS